MTVVITLGYARVPAAIGFAVLRYRLYDIDKIVSRTVSYAVITATLAGVYVGGVALLTGVLPFSGQAQISGRPAAVGVKGLPEERCGR